MQPDFLLNIDDVTLLHHAVLPSSPKDIPDSFEHCSPSCNTDIPTYTYPQPTPQDTPGTTDPHSSWASDLTPPPPFTLPRARLISSWFLYSNEHSEDPYLAAAATAYLTAAHTSGLGMPAAAFTDIQLACAYLIAHIISTQSQQPGA